MPLHTVGPISRDRLYPYPSYVSHRALGQCSHCCPIYQVSEPPAQSVATPGPGTRQPRSPCLQKMTEHRRMHPCPVGLQPTTSIKAADVKAAFSSRIANPEDRSNTLLRNVALYCLVDTA